MFLDPLFDGGMYSISLGSLVFGVGIDSISLLLLLFDFVADSSA